MIEDVMLAAIRFLIGVSSRSKLRRLSWV